MKKLEIIIRPDVFDRVRDALAGLGVHGLNYSEIRGFGRQLGHTEFYRGATMQVDFVPKIRLEVVVHDDAVQNVVDEVVKNARTGNVGDGKIFISEVLDAIRIRTGERSDGAL